VFAQGSTLLTDRLGLEQVPGGKISIRIFPFMKLQEQGTCRHQTLTSLSVIFALLEQIALTIKV
jgi:hypothetical protein